jgi:hypothetical protein
MEYVKKIYVIEMHHNIHKQTEHKNIILLGLITQLLDIVHSCAKPDIIMIIKQIHVKKQVYDTMYQQADKQHKHHVQIIINTKTKADKQAVKQ